MKHKLSPAASRALAPQTPRLRSKHHPVSPTCAIPQPVQIIYPVITGMSPVETIFRTHPRQTAAAATTAAVLLGLAVRRLLRPAPDPDELERLRREHLALHGRIIDGSLVDVAPTLARPTVIQYRYRIAGVTYERSQDISALTAQVGPLAPDPPTPIRPIDFELPVQIRYNKDNPGDSIVLSETWNGLWSLPRPHPTT